MLTAKLEDGSDKSWLHVFSPMIVLWCFNAVVKTIVSVFEICVSSEENNCVLGLATFIMSLAGNLFFTSFMSLMIPLYLDGTLTEGWQIMLPWLCITGSFGCIAILMMSAACGVGLAAIKAPTQTGETGGSYA
jgi:hypothetical protein